MCLIIIGTEGVPLNHNALNGCPVAVKKIGADAPMDLL
jgi:hypothetical protein